MLDQDLIKSLEGIVGSEKVLTSDEDVADRRHDYWVLSHLQSWVDVFEGRPNVFADATGVLRTGNTVVFRIGSDALGTAKAITQYALQPALKESGLPTGAVSLVASETHAAGWAMFSDNRLALAVARGSGDAVNQLGAVARQTGIPVSLHGTGGAWILATKTADPNDFINAIMYSLDRKVCNTLNTLILTKDRRTIYSFLLCFR